MSFTKLTFDIKDNDTKDIFDSKNILLINISGSVNVCAIRCGQEIDSCNSVKINTMTNYGNILSLNSDSNVKCNVKLPYESDGYNNYILKKIFVTVPSLHRINDMIYDMEIFIVFTSMQQNIKKNLVLCTLLSGTDAVPTSGDSKLLTYRLLNELFDGKNIVPEKFGTNPINLVPGQVDLNSFIPVSGTRSFYSYTHPKNLNTNIRIFKSTLSVSNKILSILKDKLTPKNTYENMKIFINKSINPTSGLFFYYSEDFTNNYLKNTINERFEDNSNDKNQNIENMKNNYKKKTNKKKTIKSIKKKNKLIIKKSNRKTKSKKEKKEKFTNKGEDDNVEDFDNEILDDDVEDFDNEILDDDVEDFDNEILDDDLEDFNNEILDDDDESFEDYESSTDDDDESIEDDKSLKDDKTLKDNKSKKIEKYKAKKKNLEHFAASDNKNIISVIMYVGFMLVSLLFLYIITSNVINNPNKNPLKDTDKDYFMKMFNASPDFKSSTISKIFFMILYILCIFLGLILLIYLLLFLYSPTKFLIKSSTTILWFIFIFSVISIIFLGRYLYYRNKTNDQPNNSDYSDCDKYSFKMFEWFSIQNIIDTIKGNPLTDVTYTTQLSTILKGGLGDEQIIHPLPPFNTDTNISSKINIGSLNPVFFVLFILFIPIVFILSCYLLPNNDSIYSQYVESFVSSSKAISFIYTIIYFVIFLFSISFTGLYINKNYSNIENSIMIFITLFVVTLIVLISVFLNQMIKLIKILFIILLVFLCLFLLFLGYIIYKKYFSTPKLLSPGSTTGVVSAMPTSSSSSSSSSRSSRSSSSSISSVSSTSS